MYCTAVSLHKLVPYLLTTVRLQYYSYNVLLRYKINSCFKFLVKFM